LVSGPEDLLADRAVARLIRLAREEHPEVDVAELEAGSPYQPLAAAASGSLFAEHAAVVVSGVERPSDSFLDEALAYVASPNPDAMVIFRHSGGNGGKRLVDALRAARAHEVSVVAVRYDRDKEAFAAAEFRRLGRSFEPEVLRVLVQAVGSDLRELASAVDQLATDWSGRVTSEVVERYYGGRLETTAFKVAEAAVLGETGEALRLARHALGSGLDPVPLVAALGGRLRNLAKVAGSIQSRQDPVKELGLPGWQVDQAKRALRHWRPAGLARAILAVAQADAQVKGLGGASSKTARNYAVERAIVAVARGAGGA
jgi:DNA polymerase-3 subunit delta